MSTLNSPPTNPPSELPQSTTLYTSLSTQIRKFLPLLLLLLVSFVLVLGFLFVPSVSTWLKSPALLIGRFLVFIFSVFMFSLWQFQNHLLYMPSFPDRTGRTRSISFNQRGFLSPSEYNIQYEDVYIANKLDDVLIHAWFLKQPQHEKCRTLIFCHSNACNIGFRLPNMNAQMHFLRCNVLAFEYRGYGNSAGEVSEAGLRRDAEAALVWLLEREDVLHSQIFLFGRSLGVAVSIALAAQPQYRDKIAGIIVENGFTSVEDMVIVLFRRAVRDSHPKIERVLRQFLRMYMTSQWHSLRAIAQVKCPILLISGLLDELIPPEQMYELSKAAINSRHVQLYAVLGGKHNDTFLAGGRPYYLEQLKFMREAVQQCNDNCNTTPKSFNSTISPTSSSSSQHIASVPPKLSENESFDDVP